jgi:hypothetical protein
MALSALWLSQLLTADGEESSGASSVNTSEEGAPPGCTGRCDEGCGGGVGIETK